MHHIDTVLLEQVAEASGKADSALAHPMNLAPKPADFAIQLAAQARERAEMEPESAAIDMAEDLDGLHLGPAACHASMDVQHGDGIVGGSACPTHGDALGPGCVNGLAA